MTTKSQEREVTIKHGVFWYHAPELQVINGEEKEILVQKLAFNGDTVTLTRASDIERGDQHGAFYTEDELNKLNLGASGTPALAAGTAAEESQANEPPVLEDLDDEDIVDWLMGTGMFDSRKKPTADEVVAAVGDDPDQAQRVLDAEEQAQGDKGPRVSVEERLQKVIDQGESE